MASDDDVDYDHYFSGDEHAPELADGGDSDPRSTSEESQFAPPPWDHYRRYYGKSFAAGFLPMFLFLLTGMTDYWWGVLIAGAAAAAGATETDNPTLQKVVGQPLVFSAGLLSGLVLGFAFVQAGVTVTPAPQPVMVAP